MLNDRIIIFGFACCFDVWCCFNSLLAVQVDKECTFFSANVELHAEHIYGLPATPKNVAANTEDLCNSLTNTRIFSQKTWLQLYLWWSFVRTSIRWSVVKLGWVPDSLRLSAYNISFIGEWFRLGLERTKFNNSRWAGPGRTWQSDFIGGHTFLVKLI